MRFRLPEIFLGCFLTVAVFAMGMLFANQLHFAAQYQNEHSGATEVHSVDEPSKPSKEQSEFWNAKLTDWLLAALTFFLALFTYRLWKSTDKLWKNAEADTRILQRAYLSVQPFGVAPFPSGDALLSADIGIFNAGNLPATKVGWVMYRQFDASGSKADFLIDEADIDGSITIPPKVTAIKGGHAIPNDEFDAAANRKDRESSYFYLWGRVRYLDGFKNRRHIDFCHRYNVFGQSGRKIAKERARYHEYGNSTDEG
ncbi:hypothetical protein ACVWXM_007715 [Bradyrhizobium sp. GM7.3]